MEFPVKVSIIPAPTALKHEVECIRQVEYFGAAGQSISVCLNGLPGIVFQHHNGHSPLESITTRSRRSGTIPVAYVYGQTTEPGTLHHKPGPYTMTQVILKPHALHTLLGINATAVTNTVVALSEFSAPELTMRLLEARTPADHIALLMEFLVRQRANVETRDRLVEAAVELIHRQRGAISVNDLLDCLNISERQFEKRFSQAVGVTPHFYIRIRRFNEAIRLMRARPFETLTDVAHRLNFYDQSHFIRDVRAFSGITPGNLVEKIDASHAGQPVYAYV